MFHWFNRNVVRARLPIGERVYAIGDIHGEVCLLHRLLDAVERDGRERGPARTTMVLIGDVIDRGVRSAELLRALRSLSGPVLLKGNHEAMMVAACRGDTDALDLWLRVGGQSTLAGFGVDPGEGDDPAALLSAIQAAIDPALVDWMDALPTAWSMGDYFFAHAGIRPGVPLHRQSEDDLLWIRGPFLSSRSDHGKVVVHGHSIEPGVPRLGGNRIGLDTGAHEHRLLTALGLEDDRQWLIQVRDDEAVADRSRSQANRTLVRT